jgi:hypothetical protein
MLTHYKNHDDGLESDTPVTGLSLILNINTKPALIGIVSKIGVEDFFQCTFRRSYYCYYSLPCSTTSLKDFYLSDTLIRDYNLYLA